MAATTALTVKWLVGWFGAHQRVAELTPTTIAFQKEKAAHDAVNWRIPVRL
jgi:hypothetical protein